MHVSSPPPQFTPMWGAALPTCPTVGTEGTGPPHGPKAGPRNLAPVWYPEPRCSTWYSHQGESSAAPNSGHCGPSPKELQVAML